MAWYEISLDELYHNENQYRELVLEPRQKSVKLTEMMINKVLSQLGVDVTVSDDEIRDQQAIMGIDIREMDEAQLRYLCVSMKKNFDPKALGYYVYQYDVPIAFISDPYLQGGKFKVSIEPYDTRIRFDEYEFRLRT